MRIFAGLAVAFAMIGCSSDGGGDFRLPAPTPLVTTEQVLAFSPRSRPDLVAALVERQGFLLEADIETPRRLAHFFAQIATETGGMQRIDENMNYSAERLVAVFPSQVNLAQARELAGKPRETANFVYGARLGNLGRDTDDGWNYRGSGFIQLTGRANFRERGREVGLPLEAQPSLARQPVEGLIAATAYWNARTINAAADVDDLLEVRRLVNGPAAHGLDIAQIWYGRALDVWGAEVAPPAATSSTRSLSVAQAAPDLERSGAEAALRRLGFMPGASATRSINPNAEAPAGADAASPDDAYSDALKAYQQSRGLPVTGVLDEDTLYAITDPQEWRPEPAE